jgi:hypothetical protein
MIACISPGSSSADHTLNTLRYASRLKENPPNALPYTSAASNFSANNAQIAENYLPP